MPGTLLPGAFGTGFFDWSSLPPISPPRAPPSIPPAPAPKPDGNVRAPPTLIPIVVPIPAPTERPALSFEAMSRLAIAAMNSS